MAKVKYSNVVSVNSNQIELQLLFRLASPDFDADGSIIGSRIDDVVDVRLPYTAVRELSNALNEIIKLEESQNEV